jgi:hypothetical protein
MSNNANKRRRYQMDTLPKPRTMSASERLAWDTGYTDPQLQADALAVGIVKASPQKSKRDKLKHGIRVSQNEDGTFETAKADKWTGTFNGPLSVKDEQRGLTYRYQSEMNRIGYRMGEKLEQNS